MTSLIGMLDPLAIGLLGGILLGLVVIVPLCVRTARDTVKKIKEGPTCPRCGSKDCDESTEMVNRHSGISIPKGIAGGLLFGKKGAVVGALLGSNRTDCEYHYRCRKCGHEWT